MNLNFVNPPAHVGERELWELWGIGPTSYSQVTGDPLQVGGSQFVSCPMGGFNTVSGNYFLRPQPSVTNSLRPSWAFRWYYSAAQGSQGVNSVVIATAGTGQTNGVYTVAASAGSAVLQYTIVGNVLTGVKILNPGSAYTAAPTFTLAANGGTPGTVTATIGIVAGMEVATGTDLSAEKVQFSAVGGQL